MQTSAIWYNGKTSDRIAVTVHLEESGLICFSHQDEQYRFDRLEFRIAPRIGSSPLFIDFKDGSRLEIPYSKNFSDTIAAQTPHRLLHKLETKLLYILSAVVVSVGILALTILYGIPYAAKTIAFSLPAEVEKNMGTETLAILDRTLLNASELPLSRQNQLQNDFAKIIDQFDNANDFNIQFRSSKRIGPNAFALPSGTIVFTDELVNLTDHDNELIAVLAHEIGHIRGRHTLRHVIQDSVLGIMLVILTGDLSSVSALTASIPVILAQLKHSREFETEADDYANNFLIIRNIDPNYLAKLFRKLQEIDPDNDSNNFLSSHPSTAERIQKASK